MGNGCSSNSTALASGKRHHALTGGDTRPNTLETVVFGGTGGDYFTEEAVYTLGFNVGHVIDAIYLNGTKHGGNGGR